MTKRLREKTPIRKRKKTSGNYDIFIFTIIFLAIIYLYLKEYFNY